MEREKKTESLCVELLAGSITKMTKEKKMFSSIFRIQNISHIYFPIFISLKLNVKIANVIVLKIRHHHTQHYHSNRVRLMVAMETVAPVPL